ncbi:MAG: UDP-N-acetylglucosamine 1-carboxyvinyltransferase [Bacillota bacterium]
MDKLVISGGKCLFGIVRADSAKNAVLPALAAALLTEEPCVIGPVPVLDDVTTMCEVLTCLGSSVRWEANNLVVNAAGLDRFEAPYELVRRMRASFLVVGPLLARLGKVRVAMPGGCAIGYRPVDLHLKGLQAMGAKISMGKGYVELSARRLEGTVVYLDYPSVGATENLMMAAALARERTYIENAAQEPEVVDLANMINSMGGKVKGAGTSTIRVEGVQRLSGCKHAAIPDRAEAATYMIAAAATGGEVLVSNVIPQHLRAVSAKLREAGVIMEEDGDTLKVECHRRPRSVDVKTMPYPGFPTDLQAPITSMLAIADGTGLVTETVFESRFGHVDELKRMGAQLKVEGRCLVVKGVKRLGGAPVRATDLRAGAALVIAGLVAQGKTEVTGLEHINRGYANLVGKLKALGADIQLETSP